MEDWIAYEALALENHRNPETLFFQVTKKNVEKAIKLSSSIGLTRFSSISFAPRIENIRPGKVTVTSRIESSCIKLPVDDDDDTGSKSRAS